MLSRCRVLGSVVALSVVALSIHAVSAQSTPSPATSVDAIVIVDGKLVPPGTSVDIVSGSVTCGSGLTVARDAPMTVGSVLRVSLAATKAGCAGASLTARAAGFESATPPADATGVIGGALIIGRPVALIEGTAEQTGAIQSAPDIQLVVGTGPDQRICARTRLVPPAPNAPADARPAFTELLLDPASGCAKLGDQVDLYIGDTLAQSITATAGLTRVALKINRVVRSLEEGPGLPATGSSNPADDAGGSSRRALLLALAAVIGLASAGLVAKAVVSWRHGRQ